MRIKLDITQSIWDIENFIEIINSQKNPKLRLLIKNKEAWLVIEC